MPSYSASDIFLNDFLKGVGMKYLFIITAIILSITISRAVADPIEGVEYHSESVATSNRTTAGLANPAGLGAWPIMSLDYIHNFTDSSYKGNDGVLYSNRGLFLGVEWLNHSDDIFRRKYTLAIGDRIHTNLYMGLSYSRFGGSDRYYKGRQNWKLGTLFQPRPFISLGLVIDRINEPKFAGIKRKRLYRPGTAIRPFGDRFTFSSDVRWFEGEDLSDIEGDIRMAVGPFSGISFVTDYRTEGQWRLGISVNFDRTIIGAQGKLNRHRDYAGGNYFIEVSSLSYGSAFAGASRTATLTLDEKIVEEPRQRPLFGKGGTSFFSIVRRLRKGANDPGVSGLLLNIDDIKLNFALAQELRAAIGEYRKSGKKVTVFLTTGRNLDYYLASAADKIYMDPSGFLELKGLAATARFYKGAMDKLGIRADVVRTGPHKTFADAFTETGLTDSARAQLEWLLDDLYGQFVDGISVGRRILPEQVKLLIDNGPYTALGAHKAGLIDGLKHYDEFVDGEENGGLESISFESLYKVEEYNGRWSEPKKLAIIYADGSIMAGKSRSSLLDGRVLGSATVADAIKKVRRDNTIKAVVFRVNSPGGDAIASEEIYRQLELLKGKKPLVVSMAGVAASGGYYISCPGDAILASPGTITGSIGIVFGKPDLSGFYEKIGVTTEIVKRGGHADIRSMSRPATDEELALIEKIIWEYYDDFVSKVSAWRKLDRDSVDAVGQGRVWTGKQAYQMGLVDSYGGIWEAVELARQKAKLDPRDKVEFEIFPAYGVSILPNLGAPSLETQLTALGERSEKGGIYLKQPYTLNVE